MDISREFVYALPQVTGVSDKSVKEVVNEIRSEWMGVWSAICVLFKIFSIPCSSRHYIFMFLCIFRRFRYGSGQLYISGFLILS